MRDEIVISPGRCPFGIAPARCLSSATECVSADRDWPGEGRSGKCRWRTHGRTYPGAGKRRLQAVRRGVPEGTPTLQRCESRGIATADFLQFGRGRLRAQAVRPVLQDRRRTPTGLFDGLCLGQQRTVDGDGVYPGRCCGHRYSNRPWRSKNLQERSARTERHLVMFETMPPRGGVPYDHLYVALDG